MICLSGTKCKRNSNVDNNIEELYPNAVQFASWSTFELEWLIFLFICFIFVLHIKMCVQNARFFWNVHVFYVWVWTNKKKKHEKHIDLFVFVLPSLFFVLWFDANWWLWHSFNLHRLYIYIYSRTMRYITHEHAKTWLLYEKQQICDEFVGGFKCDVGLTAQNAKRKMWI